jgi:hypothetical protein
VQQPDESDGDSEDEDDEEDGPGLSFLIQEVRSRWTRDAVRSAC